MPTIEELKQLAKAAHQKAYELETLAHVCRFAALTCEEKLSRRDCPPDWVTLFELIESGLGQIVNDASHLENQLGRLEGGSPDPDQEAA